MESFVYNASYFAAGALWSLAYALIIRRGFIDKTYGMPWVALCVNLSWEFIFGILHPDKPPGNYVNTAWFLVDLVIVYQYLRFGRRELPPGLRQTLFIPGFVLTLIAAFFGILAITYEFNDWPGGYTGWGAELLLAASYVSMLLRRDNVQGQSVYIALARLFGSIAVIPGQQILTPRSPFMFYVYAAFIVLDVVYIALYLRKCRELKINPWTRL